MFLFQKTDVVNNWSRCRFAHKLLNGCIGVLLLKDKQLERVRESVDFYLSKRSTDNQTNKNDVPVGYYFTDWYAFLC